MKICKSLLPLGLLCTVSCQQEKHTKENIAAMQLPHWTLPVFESGEFKSSYTFDTSLNPFYLNLDVNGDSTLDFAVAVQEKASGRRGIAILTAGSDSLQVFGAGNEKNSLGGNNWNWLIGWKGEHRLTAGSNIPRNPGTAFILFTDKGGANWMYWNGKEWEWVTQ